MNDFSIMSFNIWFDVYAERERTAALLACIYKNNPDVICLQEVRPHIYEKLKTNLKKYDYHYPKNIQISYGCVIFSKYKISKCLSVPFKKTLMGRELVIIKIDYPCQILEKDRLCVERVEIVICTTHLESEFNRNTKNITKWSQIEESFNILESMYERYKNVIFCLDSNLTDNDEKHNEFPFNDKQKWKDTWISNGNEENKYTFDGKKNIYLKRRQSKYRSRLDRILFKSDSCHLETFHLIKDASDYVLSWISPSDHFGILGKFEIKLT